MADTTLDYPITAIEHDVFLHGILPLLSYVDLMILTQVSKYFYRFIREYYLKKRENVLNLFPIFAQSLIHEGSGVDLVTTSVTTRFVWDNKLSVLRKGSVAVFQGFDYFVITMLPEDAPENRQAIFCMVPVVPDPLKSVYMHVCLGSIDEDVDMAAHLYMVMSHEGCAEDNTAYDIDEEPDHSLTEQWYEERTEYYPCKYPHFLIINPCGHPGNLKIVLPKGISTGFTRGYVSVKSVHPPDDVSVTDW